ncbi:MAG: Gfo/Idh/MocA family oxidoreductase [Planctomycetota bacterium]|jgi:predicted dehydrogenase
MIDKQIMNRRSFLKGTLAAAGGFFIVPRYVLGGSGYTPPSEMITHGIIGVGNMGMGHINYILNDSEGKLLAVCDVDENHLADALEVAGSDCRGYDDFRELLMRDDIDIVHIVTPPHWHGLMSIAASEAGKDIWCEKPMTRTIGEGEKVFEAVKRNGCMFRINTWFRFKGGFAGGYHTYDGSGTTVKSIKKVVIGGLLGWPLKITINDSTGLSWKLDTWSGRTNLTPQPVPSELNYDMWLGPAPAKVYHPHRVHGSFRGYWDYDGGGLGDMGQHYLDPAQYLLDKDDTSPVEVSADTAQQHPDAASPWRTVRLRYADGCEIILDGENKLTDAPFIEGPGGKIYKDFRSDIPNLREKVAALPDPEPQMMDFNESVRTRKKFALNEENGHRSCTLVNLCVAAVRLGRKLKFDPKKQRFVGDDEANRLINQPMRAPWHV